MKLQAEQKLFMASVAAIALLGVLVIVGVYQIRLSRNYEQWVRHSYEVDRGVTEVLSLAKDAETGARGYLLTGDDRFLGPYEVARDHLPDALHRVHDLILDNAEQSATFIEMQKAIYRRMELLAQIVQDRRRTGVLNRDLSPLDLGRLEMDKIRLLGKQMTDREELLLEHRQESADAAARKSQMFGSLILAAILIVVVALYLHLNASASRRRAEEALRLSESRFRLIADKVPSILWQVGVDGRFLFINRTWFEYSGCTVKEFAQDSGRRYIHSDDMVSTYATLNEAIKEGRPWKGEFRIRSRSGAYGWFLGQAIPLFGEDGKVESFVGQSVEITEQHRSQEALLAEKQKLSVTLHSIGDGVVTTDTEGRVYLLNREGEYLTGWTQAEAEGKPLSEVFRIVHEFTRLPIEDPVKKVLRTGRTVELANHTVLISRDGKERIIADSAAPIRDSGGAIIGTVLVFRDSTQKEKLAEEMLRSSKLESLGVLAGGIAHDFNNLLATVLGNISLLERFPDDREGGLGCIKESRQACLRAKDLTQQLLTFAKGGVPIKKLANLQEVVTESTRFALHGSSAQVILDVSPDLYAVMMDASQISQVLHNIVLNAAQAMPDGGVVKVQAVNVPDHASGRMVRISISDTGSGIKPEHQIKIFDPYFTTKPTGTGLGLASAYSIIKKHEGDISVESAPGQGTTFTILLPAHDEKVGPAAPDVVHDGLETGQGRLLVLEDDRMLARMLKLMLTNLGYEVSVAHTGNQAIEIYREAMTSSQPFRGCILDLTLAGSINGAETLDHIQQIDPGVKALVCSGYSNDQIVADFKKHGFCGIVTKPYAIEDIARAVHAMLASSTS
ncbi:MAG: hypothetical protein B9S32_03920 [Verrucomicrobia bacterium Tous-C9LFEB]|nr:MAG: hypothetical protein B9S32_03920 [Verrucomicrobia bacterium Tous-C9LFEB]